MRNVLVTGGSRGVGLGIAGKLAASGYRVIALARKRTDAFDAAVAAAPDGALHFKPFDLADLDAIPDFVRGLKSEFGPLYGLVNNAALGTEGLLSNMHNSQIEALVRINTISPIVLSKYAVRAMMTAGEGRIVNITSIIGSTGYSGLSVYGATKASMIGFTRSLAREVGRLGVTVNAVAPGFMATEMTESLGEKQREQIARRSALQRLVEVEDVANAVAFLLGDGGRNITGTVMTVDAGNTA
jgi:3-oxoacyl-[acyl-carrier protein] reductase